MGALDPMDEKQIEAGAQALAKSLHPAPGDGSIDWRERFDVWRSYLAHARACIGAAAAVAAVSPSPLHDGDSGG